MNRSLSVTRAPCTHVSTSDIVGRRRDREDPWRLHTTRVTIEPSANWCWTLAAPNNGCGEKMQRELAIRQLAKLEGFRLEKKDDGSYRLINARFNVAVYQHDGVLLEKIAEFLDRRTSQANSRDRYHR